MSIIAGYYRANVNLKIRACTFKSEDTIDFDTQIGRVGAPRQMIRNDYGRSTSSIPGPGSLSARNADIVGGSQRIDYSLVDVLGRGQIFSCARPSTRKRRKPPRMYQRGDLNCCGL